MRRASLLAALALLAVAAPASADKAVPGNQPPELEPPPYHSVAPGQGIAFGLHAIDPEGDVLAIELVGRPANATYDPLTLTVRWKPTAKDAPAGHFRVRLSETPRGGKTRVFFHDFSIAVDPKANPPAPPPLGDAVELLLTIHDPERLAEVNKRWPLVKTLEVMRDIQVAELPDADKKSPVDAGDGARLYKDALAAMAKVHQNPRIDPASPSFDKKAFADPASWKIVTVRPRLDKKAQELRIVYQSSAAPEPIYLMFRFRLTRDNPDAPKEEIQANNLDFTKLTYEAFFDGEQLSPRYSVDKKAHAKAVADYVTKILTHPKREFMALPHEARFGGGTARNADGGYASGDGWAWAVLKPKWVDKTLKLMSVPIPGFTTEIKPNTDGSAWATVCAAKFDPDDPAHAKGWEVLCRKKLGFTDLPVETDGKVSSSPVDATNLFHEFKTVDLVKTVDLRDARRDNFEENGMTCSQCHVRDFGNGDLREAALRNPKAGGLPSLSPRVPTTFFNIVPEESWRPFFVEFQELQQCLARDAFQKYLGKQTNLGCPLAAE